MTEIEELRKRVAKLERRRQADRDIVERAELDAAELAAWQRVADWLRHHDTRCLRWWRDGYVLVEDGLRFYRASNCHALAAKLDRDR
jgi:hypothetical protein